MIKFKLILFAFALNTLIINAEFFSILQAVQAEVKPISSKILYKIINSPFVPEKGYFFIKFGNGKVNLLKTEFYSLDVSANSNGINRYVFGSIIDNVNIQPKAMVSLALFSPEGKVTVSEEEQLSDNIQNNDQGDSLRIQIKDLGIEIRSLVDKRKKFDDELRRLRADIDLLSGAGKLKDVDKEIKRSNDELEGLKRDTVFLKQLLTSVKGVKEPRSFQQREAELIQRISTLNYEVVKNNREDTSDSSQANMDRKKMLADIGRTANIPALTKDLENLKKRRKNLEQETGRSITDDR